MKRDATAVRRVPRVSLPHLHQRRGVPGRRVGGRSASWSVRHPQRRTFLVVARLPPLKYSSACRFRVSKAYASASRQAGSWKHCTALRCCSRHAAPDKRLRRYRQRTHCGCAGRHTHACSDDREGTPGIGVTAQGLRSKEEMTLLADPPLPSPLGLPDVDSLKSVNFRPWALRASSLMLQKAISP